ILLVVLFVIMASVQLFQGGGEGTIFALHPLSHDNVDLIAVLTGATVVAFSFIGFDAITMYTEEAENSATVPKAMLFTVLIGGLIFFTASYFTQALFPDWSVFRVLDDTLPDIGLYVGGEWFQLIFLAGAFAATAASGLASHASVSRLLYVMGRHGLRHRNFFGDVNPKFRTPV